MIEPIQINPKLKYYPIGELKECVIHGRNKIVNGVLPLFFSHSGIELLLSGTELWVDIEVDFSIFEPWVAFELNGSLIMRQMLCAGRQRICLYRGMSFYNEKQAFFYRELQAMSDDENCRILIKGIYTDGRFGRVHDRRYKLEFIGDSITSGEGTYGAQGDMDWLPMYMSYSRTYAGIMEKELDAKVRMISQGGWGIYCGWDNNIHHNIPSVYFKMCGFLKGEYNKALGAFEEYKAEDWQPDAVIINLGTNDLSGFDNPPYHDETNGCSYKLSRGSDGSLNMDDLKKIEDAVRDFLRKLRRLYPEALLIWAYGMAGRGLSSFLESAVLSYSEENRDDDVYYIDLPEATEKELGSRMHPGFESHKKAARILIDQIMKLG